MKICCQWRKKVDLAIEKGEPQILDESIWGWYRFGSEISKSLTRAEESRVKHPNLNKVGGEQNNIFFDCLVCQRKVVELNKLGGVDLTNSDLVISIAQEQIEIGTIKCCQVVNLIDLDDPNKELLQQYALISKEQFQKKLCFKCLVKLNGILNSI